MDNDALGTEVERGKEWTESIDAERRRRVVKSVAWLGTVAVYFIVFCAASLLLCFVLWVASCTLEAMKS